MCSLASILKAKILFVTRSGMVKLVSGSEFDVTRKTVASTKLAEGDELVCVCSTGSYDQVVLKSADGYFLKFSISNIPETKKNALGVKGITLTGADHVESVYPLNSSVPLKAVFGDTEIVLNSRVKLTGRGGKGTKLRI